MTSTKARSAGLGAVATFAGFAASLGAGTAHAAESTGTHHAPTPNKVCTIDRDDVDVAALDKAGKPQDWQPATTYQDFKVEPSYGFAVRLKDSAKECGGSIDVSLASYTTHGATWSSSGGAQTFVGYTTTNLSKDHATATLTVKLPGTTDTACFGQLDLYFGKTIFDGGTGKGHGPLPDHDHGVTTPGGLIASWNGGTVDCIMTPPTTPPTTPPSSPQSPPSSHPSTPPSTPSTPPSSAPSTPVQPTSSAPTTPAPSTPATSTTTPPATTSSPGTPTLAHTGSNAGAISLVALAFFGAGGTVMLASRKAAARKH